MARSWLVSVIKRRNVLPVVSSMQPRPVFFTEEQLKRMEQTEGSYQFKGDSNGKKSHA